MSDLHFGEYECIFAPEMKRKLSISLLFVALLMALSPCVEVFSFALQRHFSHSEMSCCSRPSTVEEKAGKSCCKKTDVVETGASCGHSGEEQHGQCGPQCHCSCCGHAATIFIAYLFDFQYVEIAYQQPCYSSGYHFDYTETIWQPPRMVG